MRKPNITKPARPQMEVYNSSHASGWMYNALPSPLTSLYSIIMAGSITGLAYFVGDKWGGGDGMLWSTIAIAAMTVIGLIIMGFRARRAKKEAQEDGEGFDSALKGSAAGWDSSVSDPGEIARMDNLRKEFFKGIQTFQEYGKDLYSLPWYVIVGEPGSGKSEAIRRSELRFPDTLQDKLQGTGGTYSMHWWFTNQAIILDTAGAMLMQPEASSRFEEFLKLLAAHRPACPINGMILTIPTDSLLSDPPSVTEQKARTIATQLAMIQKALDVRFPIYLMVSKSDRLPGFREFFDMEGQSKFERQMMGWSNPQPLGEAFHSESVYSAIDTISRRLQSRALALLGDPVPPNPSSRRADEVDAAYTFPSVVRTLAPRLKLYLDVIFQTGTWATKPPFFRGIFFTTALREGAQLDLDLAKSLGMPLNQLPPGGIFAREKSSFLRDLFLEKIFQEQGLVTRLFDVGAHLRKRLTTFYVVTAVLLLTALGFALMVKNIIETRLERDQAMWASANVTWQNGTFLPVISRSSSYSQAVPDRPQWNLSDTLKSPLRPNDPLTPAEMLQEIRDRVFDKISLSWFFSPVPEWRDFLARRELGYFTLFEGSVMKPLLDGVRERILWDIAPGNTTTMDTQQRLAAAYRRLLELESWLAKDDAKPAPEIWKGWFSDLLAYVTDPAVPGGVPRSLPLGSPHPVTAKALSTHELAQLSGDLADLASHVYGTHVSLAKRDWMSEMADDRGPARLRSLTEGSRLLLGISGEVEQSKDMEAQTLEKLDSAARAFLTTEAELERIQTEGQDVPLTRVRQLLSDLAAHASRIEASKPLGGSAQAMTQFKEYLLQIQKLAEELENEDKFFGNLRMQVTDLLSGKTRQNDLQLPADLVENVMKEGCYKTRLDLYLKALADNYQQVTAQQVVKGNHIGRLGTLMTITPPPTSAVAGATPPEPAYKGPRQEVFAHIHGELIPSYKDAHVIELKLTGYLQEVSAKLPEFLRFPLVRETDRPFTRADMDDFKASCSLLAKIGADQEVFNERKKDLKPGEGAARLDQLFNLLTPVIAVSRALYNDQLKDLRKITVEPSKPQEFKEEPPPPPAPFVPGQPPVFVAPLPPKIIPGFKDLIIETSDGDFITQTASNVMRKEVPCTVGIKVTYTYVSAAASTSAGSRDVYSAYNGDWGIVKAIMSKGRVLRIGNILSISLDCTPAPPSNWPSRASFRDFLTPAPGRTLPTR